MVQYLHFRILKFPLRNWEVICSIADTCRSASFFLRSTAVMMMGLLVWLCRRSLPKALAASTPRKCWVAFADIVQTHRHLQNEKAWITLCLRTSLVQKEAGMSQVFKILLKMIFQSGQTDSGHGALAARAWWLCCLVWKNAIQDDFGIHVARWCCSQAMLVVKRRCLESCYPKFPNERRSVRQVASVVMSCIHVRWWYACTKPAPGVYIFIHSRVIAHLNIV